MATVVIADIVGSRELTDRAAAQKQLEDVLERAAEAMPPDARADHPLHAVVGDELQGAFPSLAAASAGTMLLRLALPEGIDLRFGIGIGEVEQIPSAVGTLAEGPAWWAARAAVERAEALARREVPQARTWVVAADDADDEFVRIANAAALTRDQIIGRWSPRIRRLVYGRIIGATQSELADAERITQSAVSQTLSTAGATAVIVSFAALTGAA